MVRSHLRFHYAHLLKRSHFWAFLILASAITFQSIIPLRSLCETVGLRVSWAYFPIWLTSDFSRMLQFTVVFLFSSAPFVYPSTPFLWVRSTRGKAFAGTASYIFSASALYLIYLQVLSLLILVPWVYFGDAWGKILYNAAHSMLAFEHNVMAMRYAMNALKLTGPFQAMLVGWGISFLQFSLIAWLMLTVSLVWPKQNGLPLVASLIYVFSPDIVKAFGRPRNNLYFPASWQNLSHMQIGTSVETVYLTPAQVALTLGGMILFCMLICYNIFRKLEPFPERV